MAFRNVKFFLNLVLNRRTSMVLRTNQNFIHSYRNVYVNQRWNQHELKSDSNTKLNESDLGPKIISSTNPNDLLLVASENKLSLPDMIKIIDRFGQWKDKGTSDLKEILNDDRFSQLCLNLESEIRSISSNGLIKCLKNLLLLGLSSESYVIKSLENELLWRIRKMTLRQISTCLSFHKDFVETDQQREIVLELVDSIQKRWFDINNQDDLILVLRLAHMLRDDSVMKILDRALDLVGSMPIDSLVKIFCMLSKSKQRPTPLLRAITYHIKQSEEQLSIRKLVNLTYAMHVLNFRDTGLLDRVCDDLLPEISNINRSSIIAAFLTAFGNLQYCNSAVLEQFFTWIKNNPDTCRNQDLCTCILTLGRLNYIPVEDSSVIDMIVAKVSQDLTPPKIWLDVVWSLVQIQKANHHHLASVLTPDFYRALIDKENHSTSLNKLKLLNINAAAKFDVNDYSGPFLMYEPSMEDVQQKLSGDKLFLHKSIIESLTQIITVNKGLATDIMTKMGFQIDAEFTVDDNIVPSPLTENIRDIEIKGPHELSPNLHRVAVLVWTYRDLTLNTSAPIGVNAFAVRLLKKLGYNVVEIYFNEVNERMTSEQRVAFLKKKIQDSIALRQD